MLFLKGRKDTNEQFRNNRNRRTGTGNATAINRRKEWRYARTDYNRSRFFSIEAICSS